MFRTFNPLHSQRKINVLLWFGHVTTFGLDFYHGNEVPPILSRSKGRKAKCQKRKTQFVLFVIFSKARNMENHSNVIIM